ncbi:MAG TPA: hypothetical protein VF823_03210 [Anaerolineales bacterium]
MSDQKDRKISLPNRNLWNDLILRVKLILRLMGDKRVNPLLKVLPIASLIYLVWPIDIPGPIDDAAVLWIGNYLFVELCPPAVVQEHMKDLDRTITGEWHDPLKKGSEEVIDGEFHEIK